MSDADPKAFTRRLVAGLMGVLLWVAISLVAVFSELGFTPIAFAVAAISLTAIAVGALVTVILSEGVRRILSEGTGRNNSRS